MGIALCRFKNCHHSGSQHYYLSGGPLTEKGIYLFIPEMWRHYMEVHGFQVHTQHRQWIMALDPTDPSVSGEFVQTRSSAGAREVKVLCVEQEETTHGYNHSIGGIDHVFINHLSKILQRFHPVQTKGFIRTEE